MLWKLKYVFKMSDMVNLENQSTATEENAQDHLVASPHFTNAVKDTNLDYSVTRGVSLSLVSIYGFLGHELSHSCS